MRHYFDLNMIVMQGITTYVTSQAAQIWMIMLIFIVLESSVDAFLLSSSVAK